jgi:hypothetical protein
VNRLPVCVLEHNIIHEFERLAASNNMDLRRTVDARQVKPLIDLRVDQLPPIGPKADLTERTILLHESHLALLWAYIYSSFVIYEQGVQKPMLDKTYDNAIHFSSELMVRAKRLQDWAYGFSHEYSDWDESSMPSPRSFRDETEKLYCDKANAVYLKAVCYLLLHEYAHLTLGHLPADEDATWSIEQETDADNFAMSCMIEDRSSEVERQIVGLSITLLCASNFLLQKDWRGIWQTYHPHLHDRLRNSIVALDLHSEESQFYVYFLAAIALRQYLLSQSIEVPRQETETAEQLFYEYLDSIDQVRQSEHLK